MSESFKVCPICQTPNHANAAVCTTCGTDLSDVDAVARRTQTSSTTTDYDFRYGETDLLEESLSRPARIYMVIFIVVLIGAMGGLIYLGINSGLFTPPDAAAPLTDASPMTDTPMPEQNLPTVTLGPPTATASYTPSMTFTPSATPTRGPCTITVPAGRSLIWALGQCGHRSLDIQNEVLERNGLANAGQIRAGQQIEIPWPTSTPDPNATPSATPTLPSSNNESGSSGGGESDNTIAVANANESDSAIAVDESIQAFAATSTPTLPPGIQWHTVQSDESIITVASRYSTDVKTLSELNQEIEFPRCDFGQTFGGPDCIVQLFVGQQLRVPAPTPTPTLSPTPDPNSTATPTATPTYNKPTITSPADGTFFNAEQLITLRWVPSATLRNNESYRVDVVDTTTGSRYTTLTKSISFVIPPEWRSTREPRHTYEWTVGIVQDDTTDNIRYQTEPSTFVWQGSTESN